MTSPADEHAFEQNRIAKPALAVIVATLVFSLAKDILVPFAVAAILALVCSPVVNRLERFIGRLVSVVLVVGVALITAGGIGYFLTFELTSVAVELTAYSDNIANKLSSLEKKTPEWLKQVQGAVKDVERQVNGAKQKKRAPNTVVTANPESSSVGEIVKPAVPLITGIADAVIVVALLFFLLYERKALRARFVRLAARARMTIAAEAIDAAGEAVGQYLFVYSMVNAAFGLAVGLITFYFGLPNPWFWGVLSFLLRFVPYIGAFTSALLPTAVAFAISSGWSLSLELLACLVAMDQILAQFLEPVVIGHGIGVSAVALLISAMYWAWLWGPVGLILAVPMTVSLKVAGDFIPALSFFSLLLAADIPNGGYQDFYRRLLEEDEAGARELASRHCDEYGLEATFDDFLTPAVHLTGEERAGDHISEETAQFVIETIKSLVPDLGSRLQSTRFGTPVRVLGACPPAENHCLGLLMVLEVLHRNGANTRFVSGDSTIEETKKIARAFVPDLVCISCTVNEHVDAAIELVGALKAEFAEISIIAGGRASITNASALLSAGCRQVCKSRTQAVWLFQRIRPSTGNRTATLSSSRERLSTAISKTV